MAKDNNLTDFLVDTANAIRIVYDYASSFKINPQDFYDYITGLKNPQGNILLTTSSSTDVTNYATATVRSASSYSLAITDKSAALTQGAISVVDGSVLFTTSLTGTFTAGTTGWFSSGSATDSSVQVGKLNRVALTSGTTEPTGTTLVTITPGSSNKWVYASTAGYCITPGETAPKVKINGDSNLAAGNIKNGVSIFGVTGTYQGLVPTGNIELTTNASTNVTNYATATVRSASTFTMTGSAVTDTVSLGTVSSGYYPVNAKVKGTISAGTAGWFSSSGAVQAGTATQVGKIAAGSITNNTSGGTSSGTVNFGSQIKIGAGYYPSDLYYTAQNPSGNIQLTQSSSTNVASYATATVQTGSSTTPATSITANPSTPTWNSSTSKYDISVSATKSVTPTVSAGWVSSGTAGTITVSGSSTLNQSTFATGTPPSGTTPTALSKNSTYKLSAGYYPSDRYYSTQADPTLSGDAAVGNVLSGKTFYSNSYTKQTGTMTNNGAVSQSLNTSTTSYTIPAGYHNGSGTVSITTETKTASGSGDITPSSGKVLSKVTVGAGSATPSATVSGSSSALSSTTAMNNQYFSVTPKATVGTAGWISSISDGSAVNYKVKDGSATTPATTITANPSAPTLSNNKYYVTVSKTQNVTPSVSAGWVSSGTAGTITVTGSTEITKGAITNNTSGGTSSGTINRGSQIKIGAGWYPSDLYYTAQSTSGNIELTTNSSTNVAAYSTATVRSASSYSLAITDQSSTQLTLNSVASATGRASFKTSLTGTLTAGTSGWFSSGSATDSSVIVGYVGPAILTTGNTEPTGTVAATVTPSTVNQWVYAATAGYFNVPGIVSSPKIKVNGDANLVAGNIKQGVSIFGVTGTYSGGGSIHPDMELLASGTIYCGPRTIDPSDCECTLDLRRVSSGTFPTIVSLHGRNDHYDVYWSGGSDEEFIFDIGSFTDNLYENPFTILISCSDAQSATTSDIATIIFYLENIDTGSYAEKSQEYIGPNVGITSIAILIWATEYQGDEKLNYAIFRMYSDL